MLQCLGFGVLWGSVRAFETSSLNLQPLGAGMEDHGSEISGLGFRV